MRLRSLLVLPTTVVPGTVIHVPLVKYCSQKTVGGTTVSRPITNWALPTVTGNGNTTCAQCAPLVPLCQ